MSFAQAKQLRTRMTDAEQRLWYRLRAHRFGGVKFKRQVPLGSYVVDFICFERKLIIEVDGGQHAESLSDRSRDEWLTSQGFRILRFWNNDVLQRADTVLDEIRCAIAIPEIATPSPDALRASPSPTRGERKQNSKSGHA